jgi:hypothetical protein
MMSKCPPPDSIELEIVSDRERLGSDRLTNLKEALLDGRTVMVTDASPLTDQEKARLRGFLAIRKYRLRLRHRPAGVLAWVVREPAQ